MWFVLVVSALVAWPVTSSAEQAAEFETDNALLRQGLELFEAVEYERAVEVLSAALLEQGNDTQELVQIYRTLGTLYVYLGREAEAEAALRRLCCAAPEFQFDEYASPRIREVYSRVRAQWVEAGRQCESHATEEAAPVTMDHLSPDVTGADEALDITVTIEDPEMRVATVVLFYRASGESGFNQSAASMVQPGTFSVTIPGDAVQPPAAEYYLEAQDDTGESLAGQGTSRAPLRVPVREPEDRGRSVVRTWWFWSIIGGVVVATALGLGLGLGLDGDPDDATLTIQICDGENPGTCFN